MGKPLATLKNKLNALCARYNSNEALAKDPLSIALGFADPLDQELAAFLAAHLAYGRVDPMLRAIRSALAPLGPRPSLWLREQSPERLRHQLTGDLGTWAWRFHTTPDLVAWILAWKQLDDESGSGLEPHLLPAAGRTPDRALSALMQRLRRELPASYGLRFNLPDPLEGSACKRWRMFLRWLVRTDWPDLGLWTRYPSDSLVIPLDTHVARISRFIGLTSRVTPDGRMALEITDALRRLDPNDPLRFDFALSHLGILGDCPGIRQRSTCAACPLYSVCRAGSKTGSNPTR